MGEDDFDQLIASLGEVLLLTDDDLSLGGGLRLPSAIDVAAIRQKTGLSQAAFAIRIDVPVGTIRNWEQGRRAPQGPARVLLALLDRNPRIVEDTLGKKDLSRGTAIALRQGSPRPAMLSMLGRSIVPHCF
jgi:putative transcriptional regulator